MVQKLPSRMRKRFIGIVEPAKSPEDVEAFWRNVALNPALVVRLESQEGNLVGLFSSLGDAMHYARADNLSGVIAASKIDDPSWPGDRVAWQVRQVTITESERLPS